LPTPTASIPAAVRFWARATPDAIALWDGDEAWSYAELEAIGRDVAARLAGSGAGAGDHVALLAENRAEWVFGFLGCLLAGAVVVPLNTRLGEAELARQLEVADPRLTLASSRHQERLARMAGERPRLLLDRDAGGSIWTAPVAPAAESVPQPDMPALVSFTSGSTGRPKGAVIGHGALAASAAVYARLLGTDGSTRTLVLVPLFHNTGFVDQLAHMLMVGGSVDLLPDFHVRDAIAALRRRPASYLIAVPSIFRLMMLDPEAGSAFAGCRILAYGGSPMPPAWIHELHARWPEMQPYDIYGLTEFTSLSHALEPADAIARAGTVGRPVDGVSQRIVDGEVWVSGPTRMLGYLGDPAATSAVFRGAWLRTGDLGAIDEDGFLTLHGRAADVIVRGGEKIHASQVEGELGALADVAEAAVVGVPDEILQERVAACIVPRPGHVFDPDQARAELRRRIADYAIPETFVVVEAIPRNANGKIDRAEVRAAVTA
jgi:acyl-CoA synthetase (AMP-forming)/AMP-acid ligase II